jgi:hypothetical protein
MRYGCAVAITIAIRAGPRFVADEKGPAKVAPNAEPGKAPLH